MVRVCAHEPIEITPQMRAAGVAALETYRDSAGEEQIVAEVYRTMRLLEPREARDDKYPAQCAPEESRRCNESRS